MINYINLQKQLYYAYKINRYKENILDNIKLPKHKKYEFINALERLFISLLQVYKFPSELLCSNQYVKKFIKELHQKHLQINNVISIINNCYNDMVQMKNYAEFANDTECINAEINYEDNYIKYLDFCIYIPRKRLKMLQRILHEYNKKNSQIYNNNYICLTVLKYDNILNMGNQWRVNMNFYNNLYKKYKVDIEGFASPLNAVYINKQVSFCSIFNSDSIFGSIGNFFNLTLDMVKNKTISINPPFIEYILNNVSDKVLLWLNETKIRLLIITPDWVDAYYYKNFIKSKYLKYHKIYDKKKLPVEHVKGKEIKVINNNFVMSFFILSNL